MTLAFLMTLSFGLMALGLGVIILILFLRMNTYVQNLSRISAKRMNLDQVVDSIFTWI